MKENNRPERALTWKTCLKVGVSAFVLFLCTYYWKSISGILASVVGALSPVFIGFAIAYVLNILMSFYERYYFRKSKKKIVNMTRRPVCLTGAFLTMAGIIALIVIFVSFIFTNVFFSLLLAIVINYLLSLKGGAEND